MATIANVCKLINQNFDKENVKTADSNGFIRPMRDTAGKTVRMIKTGIFYKGTPSDQVESDVQMKYNEIKTFLARHGGTIETESKKGFTMNFTNSKGKHTFSIVFNRHDFATAENTYHKQVYLEFFSIKA